MQALSTLDIETQIAMCKMVTSLKQLQLSVERFRSSLYRQKHAFYFRMVKQWTVCLSVSVGAALYSYLKTTFVKEWDGENRR